MSLWHRIEHALGWNSGHPEAFRIRERLHIGFRCSGCGSISGVEEIDDVVDRMIARAARNQGDADGGGGGNGR